MDVLRAIALFLTAAVAEIGGAFLIWRAVREDGSWWLAPLGGGALIVYGFVATLQPDANFGRILAAYGGVFVVGRSPGAWCSTGSGRTATTCRARSSVWSASR